MTCVFGEREALLALLCQPAELQSSVRVPSELEFWGVDSGERHAVGGSDYGAVRTGAFMGLRLLRAEAGLSTEYLANISPEEFERGLARYLPDEMTGDAFLARYGHTEDSVTTVQPGRHYRVRAPTSHPVYERQRAEEFRHLLTNSPDEAACVRLGELMYRSHASYGQCGLGSPGTDRLVELVRREGTASRVVRRTNHRRRQRRNSRGPRAPRCRSRDRARCRGLRARHRLSPTMSSRVRRPACWRSAAGRSCSDSHAWREI